MSYKENIQQVTLRGDAYVLWEYASDERQDVICLTGKRNSSFSLSTVILFRFMHNGERHKVEETKQYNLTRRQNGVGNTVDKSTKGRLGGIVLGVTYF